MERNVPSDTYVLVSGNSSPDLIFIDLYVNYGCKGKIRDG